jgi:hypothetical protein
MIVVFRLFDCRLTLFQYYPYSYLLKYQGTLFIMPRVMHLQNCVLNMKALKLLHSELSSLWQCSGRNQISELIIHSGQKTPYKPAPITKHYCYICSSLSPVVIIKWQWQMGEIVWGYTSIRAARNTPCTITCSHVKAISVVWMEQMPRRNGWG